MVNICGICNRTGGYFTKIALSNLRLIPHTKIMKRLGFPGFLQSVAFAGAIRNSFKFDVP
jgi:hypothetical protein